MPHALVGRSSVDPVTRARPPPKGSIWYATTGTFVLMWKAFAVPLPCRDASPCTAGVTPSGQPASTRGSLGFGSFRAAGSRDKKSTATPFAGSPCAASNGAYCVCVPFPTGMRAKSAMGSTCPSRSTWIFAGSPVGHWLTTNTA